VWFPRPGYPKTELEAKEKRMPHPPVVAQRPELKTFRQPVAGREQPQSGITPILAEIKQVLEKLFGYDHPVAGK
jgi:hypothetical protein